MDRRLDTWLRARRIDNDICAESQLALFNQVLGVLVCAHARAAELVRRRVVERKRQPLLVDVDGDNLLRAVRLGDSTAQKSDWARAEDYHAVPGLDARLPCDVDGDGGGLDQGAFLQAHVLGQLEAVVLREGVVPRKCTVVRRCRGECHVRAQVVFAFLASYAATARHTRLHGDAVADLQCLDLVADLVHYASRLVAQNHGRLDDEVPDAAFDPVMHI